VATIYVDVSRNAVKTQPLKPSLSTVVSMILDLGS